MSIFESKPVDGVYPKFILATNDMDAEGFPAARKLSEYKAQQGVERGFRFLKD